MSCLQAPKINTWESPHPQTKLKYLAKEGFGVVRYRWGQGWKAYVGLAPLWKKIQFHLHSGKAM